MDCKTCHHFQYWGCTACAGIAEQYLTTCILTDTRFDALRNPDSLESFCMKQQPILLLQFLGKQTNQFPQIGDFAVSLTSGFRSTEPGVLLRVIDIQSYGISLEDAKHHHFCVSQKTWYEKLFLLDASFLTKGAKQPFLSTESEKDGDDNVS